MTGRGRDGDSDWEGPEWAAPENAERLASCPVEGRRDRMFGLLCRALTNGLIDPAGFWNVMQIKLMIEKGQQ